MCGLGGKCKGEHDICGVFAFGSLVCQQATDCGVAAPFLAKLLLVPLRVVDAQRKMSDKSEVSNVFSVVKNGWIGWPQSNPKPKTHNCYFF